MFERIFRSRRGATLFAVLRRSAHIFLVVQWDAATDAVLPLFAFADAEVTIQSGYVCFGCVVRVEETAYPKQDAVRCAQQQAAQSIR